MKLAHARGFGGPVEAISANGYDAEDVDREIAADNARADGLGLVLDSDPRFDQGTAQVGTTGVAPQAPANASRKGN